MTGESRCGASLDAAVEALADEERRRLVAALDRRGGSEGWVDVSRVAVATSADADAAVTLRHVHLPKLASSGVVDWDRADDRVRPGPCFDAVARLADAISTTGTQALATDDAQTASASERSR